MKWMLATLMVAAMALSGCTDGGDETEHTGPTAEECAALGLVLGEREVMSDHAMDDNGTMEDHDATMHHTEPACVAAGPPATVTIEGVPESVQAFTPVEITWVLHTDANESHAMRTDVRFDTQANVGAECTPESELQKPDDWGVEVGKKEHQNFVDGQSYNATFTPEEPGEYCFRAYALVSQTNIWSEAVVLNVTPVQPTGTVHEVHVDGGGILGGLDPEDLEITLGDEVSWHNDDPAGSFTITGTGPEDFSTTAGGDAVLLGIPGSYSYTATGQLGSYSGTITVSATA